MVPGWSSAPWVRWGRWTPARLIGVGAVLGFAAVGLDAAVALSSNLALLQGVLGAVPFPIVLLDTAMMGFLVPAGLFLVLCGIALHLRAQRPPGRSLAFRGALSGAGLHLTAGLLLGVLNVSLVVLPSNVFSIDLVRTLVLVLFVGTVAAGVGLLVALCGIAALVRQGAGVGDGGIGVRPPASPGKTIY